MSYLEDKLGWYFLWSTSVVLFDALSFLLALRRSTHIWKTKYLKIILMCIQHLQVIKHSISGSMLCGKRALLG